MFAKRVVILLCFVLCLVIPAFARTVVLPLGWNPSRIAKRDTDTRGGNSSTNAKKNKDASENWKKFTYINPKTHAVIVIIYSKTHRPNGRDRFLPPGTLIVEPDSLVTVESVQVQDESLVNLCKSYVSANCATTLQSINRMRSTTMPFTATIQVPRNFVKSQPVQNGTPKSKTKPKTKPQPVQLNFEYLLYIELLIVYVLFAYFLYQWATSQKTKRKLVLVIPPKFSFCTAKLKNGVELIRRMGLAAIGHVKKISFKRPSLPKYKYLLTVEEREDLRRFCSEFENFVKKAMSIPIPGEKSVVDISWKIKNNGFIQIKVFPTGTRIFPDIKNFRSDSLKLDELILKQPFASNFRRGAIPSHTTSWRTAKAGVKFTYQREN